MSEPLPISVPPAEAIRFFEAKGRRVGFDWQDVMHEQHACDFTVAKMTELDLLDDTHAALAGALREGQDFRTFAAGLAPLLQAKGWWGVQERTDPLTGETRLVQLDSERRLRIIYDTNMRMAHAAGQRERITRLQAARPFLRYVAVLDARTRPAHRAWHGIILPVGHPWWRTHYPPNGWRCRCGVQQLSERDLQRYGWQVSEPPPIEARPWTNPRTGQTIWVPEGIDPGFGYNVGVAGQSAALARQVMDQAAVLTPELATPALSPFLPQILPALTREFGDWLDGLDPARPRGERRVVGLLSQAVLDGLSARGQMPGSSAITILDRVVGHLLRDAKAARGTALPVDTLKRLPEVLAAPAAVLWDRIDPALLYVFKLPGGPRLGKVVVRVDLAERGRDADGTRRVIDTNAVRSGGLVDRTNLADPQRYQVLTGML